MLQTDKDALLCDLAETYNIYDYSGLPLITVGRLACGLRDNSRIKMIMAHQTVPLDTLLYAMAVDGLNLLLWSKTKDGQNNRNRPDSIVEALQVRDKQPKADDVRVFDSVDELEATLKRIREGNK